MTETLPRWPPAWAWMLRDLRAEVEPRVERSPAAAYYERPGQREHVQAATGTPQQPPKTNAAFWLARSAAATYAWGGRARCMSIGCPSNGLRRDPQRVAGRAYRSSPPQQRRRRDR